MAMYSAHIAFMLELLALAAGLVALHHAAVTKSNLILWAGRILVIGSVLSIACMLYFSTRYMMHGHFKHAYGEQMMKGGMMPNAH